MPPTTDSFQYYPPIYAQVFEVVPSFWFAYQNPACINLVFSNPTNIFMVLY